MAHDLSEGTGAILPPSSPAEPPSPALSVIVLTWNEAANIGDCLAALGRQDTSDFEVVVVDAASHDGTLQAVEAAQAAFPVPLRLDAAPSYLAIGAARNRGVRLARAPLVAFVSADAQPAPDWVRRAREALAVFDMAFSHQEHRPRRWTVGAAVRGLRYAFPRVPDERTRKYASNVAAAYRRSVLERLPFPPQSNAAEDLLLAARAEAAGFTGIYLPAMRVRHSDVADGRAELRKMVREAEAWGTHADELGLHRVAFAWGVLVCAAAVAALTFPSAWSAAALVAAFWAPGLWRGWRGRHALPPLALVAGVAATPFFDAAFVVHYAPALAARPEPAGFWARRHAGARRTLAARLPRSRVPPSARPTQTPLALRPDPPGALSMTPNPAPHAQAITAFQAGPDTATGTPPTRPRRTTVLIILDAARADYVRPDTMPFLHGLSRQSMHGALESPPGFAQRTVLFSGRYPDTSGRFSQFVFDPEASPFAWTRALGPLRHLVKARRRYVPARHAIAAVTKLATGAEHPDPAWIPGRYLPFFRPCEDMRPIHDPGATGGTSIFDLARAHALSYRYLAHPVSGDDDAVHRTLVRDLRKGTPRDLYVAQFSVTDQKGHTHGPFSPEMETKHLRELDRKLATIHAALAAGYDEWDLLLVGDHGMAPVRRRLDIQAALKTIAAVPGKDYVVFVNSTLAVFWYLTPKGRRDVERLVANLPDVEPLDTEDRKAARIPTDRAWGDRMVAATPGLLFWPDYFHVKSANIVGMHGYLDKSQEGNGIAVLASSRTGLPTRNFGVRPLVDVFPTLCDLLGVPVPDGQEGTSLLTRTTRARHLLQEEPAFGAVGPAPTAPEPAHAEPTLAMPSTSALEPRGLGPIAGDGQLVLEADATTGQTSQPSIRLVELAPSAASARALSTSRGAAAHGATSPQGGEAAVAMAVVEDAAPDAT